MAQCLVTKLKGKVNDSSLLKLGEMRLSINKDITPKGVTRSLLVTFKESTVLEALDGHFTDIGLSNNLGKTSNYLANESKLFTVSNEDCTISLNKYLLQSISRNDYIEKMQLNLDIADFKYSLLTAINLPNAVNVNGDISALSNLTELTLIDLNNSQVSGDIAALGKLSKVANVNLTNTQVSGDIAALKNLTLLPDVKLALTQVSGDISALSNLTELSQIALSSTQVRGDIAALGKLSKVATISIPNTQVSGDISALSNLTKLQEINFYETPQVGGDIAVLPENILRVYLGKSNNVTWSTRPSSYSIFNLEGANLGDSVDKMLINMANCTNKTTTSNNKISVFGTRTSASDAAVQTLQSKGYTVSITPA